MISEALVETFTCVNCGHTWTPRTPHPKVCPKCKSFSWSTPGVLASKPELGWMAGIVDGEGSIGVYRVKNEDRTYPYYNLRVQVGVTVGQDLSRFVEYFGGSQTLHKQRYPQSKPLVYWILTNGNALRVLKVLLPFLVWKRKQAELGIEFQESKRDSSDSGLTEQEREYREGVCMRMKELNKREMSTWELEEVENEVNTESESSDQK